MVENIHKYWTFILLITFSKCNGKEMEPFIVGGDFVKINYFPHSVFLSVECDHLWICGSSILNQRLLLTAAHCLEGCAGRYKVDAFAGHSNLNKVQIIRRVKRIAIHEKYDAKTIHNDIGIVFLKNNLPMGKYIKKVIIRSSFPSVEKASVAGWGVVNDATGETSQALKSVLQKLRTPWKCSEVVKLRPGMMCAESVYRDHRPSEGDSGSALITSSNEQIGLVSFRRRKSRDVIIYTNVTHYYKWIQVAAKKLYCRGI